MGLGAAGIMPTTLSILTNIFPDDERPKAIAIWAAVAGHRHRDRPDHRRLADRALRLERHVPGEPAGRRRRLAGAAALVPESRDPDAPRLDLPGAGLSIAALTAIVWALIEAPERGWTQPVDPRRVRRAALADAGRLRRLGAPHATQPMIDVSVFRNPRFSAASLSITFVYFALMGVMFFLTTYMQSVLGYRRSDTGVRMLPIAVGMVMASRASVALVGRVGTKVIVAAGLATVALALIVFAGLDVDTGYTTSPPRSSSWAPAWAWRWPPPPRRSWARCRRPRPASARR